MIELVVKTLDSQNHSFTVEDDITVAQFKEKIAETVNIPADTQRIIYCGRVLQDDTKLNDYDVNGKVVHLVQRPPPSLNQRSRPATPPPHRRHFRGPEHGNAMYLGSMAIPSSFPPLSTHSLSASRLNVARRMLRRAEAVLNSLDNPSSQSSDQPPQEEQQEEITPVFEARVIVPGSASNDPIDEAVLSAVENAVQNSLLNVGAMPLNASQPIILQEGSTSQSEPSGERNSEVEDANSPRVNSLSSTPGIASPLVASTENISTFNHQDVPSAMDTSNTAETGEPAATTADAPQAETSETATAPSSEAPSTNTSESNSENVSRTSEYADLLDNLSRFQIRFASYLERYNNFMREDAVVPEEDARQMQSFLNHVSEILHFLGHAYHALSDIIVRVRTPPPRPLLCRPIVIQHSAVVQAGIPIQLEAQINISPDNNNTTNNQASQAQSQTPSTATGATQEASSTTRDVPVTSATSSTAPTISTILQPTVVQPAVVGFPVFPGPGGMRVQPIPLEIRGLSAPRNISLTFPRGSNNNNNNLPAANALNIPVSVPTSNVAADQSTTTTSAESTSTSSEGNTTVTTSAGTGRPQSATFSLPGFSNNPNMEVFMEVTPESITIDSLETTFVRGGQPNEIAVLNGAFNNPPPDLLNSIWQMAGQLVNRGMQPTQNSTATTVTTSATTPSAPPAERSTACESTAQTSTNLSSSGSPMQNSQARGNTQTNPTTATHTRSTSRPHVHLAQHAMQGFDPFLPCNSHHVTPWRRFQAPSQQSAPSNQQQNAQNATERPRAEAAAASGGGGGGGPQARVYPINNTIFSILQGIMNSIQNAYGQQAQQAAQRAAGAQSQTAATNAGASGGTSHVGSSAAASQSSGDGVGAGAPGSLPFQLLQMFLPHLQNINLSDANSSGPTIAELLQQFPEESTPEGESLFSDLITLFSRHLTIGDLIQLTNGHLEPLMRIRSSIRNFFLTRVLDGSQTSVAIDRGVNRMISEMQPLFDHLSHMPTRDDIDIARSAQILFRTRLPNIISLAASRSPNSLRMLVDQCQITAKQLGALVLRASKNGQQGVESVLDSIVTHHTRGIPRNIQQWTLMTSRTQMRQFVANVNVPESILQPYIVRKVDAITSSVVASVEKVEQQEEQAMQVDDQEASSSSDTTAINLSDDTEPLPAVVLGTEAWHNDVPADWVPIIARDTQRQRRQNSQAPFSDSYLSGMPSKRRKIVTSAKPQGSLPQVISESVRRAVTSTGLAPVAPLEVVAQGAGSDINIQSAYRDLLRSSVRASLRGNADFTPDRFPNATNYFNSPQ